MFNADFFTYLDRNALSANAFRMLAYSARQARDEFHELENDKRVEYNALDDAIGKFDDDAFKRFGGFVWPDDVKAEYAELDEKWYEAQDAYYRTSEVTSLFDDLVPALREVTDILERLEQLRDRG